MIIPSRSMDMRHLSKYTVSAAFIVITLLVYLQGSPNLYAHHTRPDSSFHTTAKSHYHEHYHHNDSAETVGKEPSNEFPDLKNFNESRLESRPYKPYPAYNSAEWRKRWQGSHRACVGPRGVEVNENPADMPKAYRIQEPLTLPEPVFGSYHESGLDADHCFDRYSRLESYGFHGKKKRTNASMSVDWSKVDWGSLQHKCLLRNEDRFCHIPSPDATLTRLRAPQSANELGAHQAHNKHQQHPAAAQKDKKCKKRTAVVLRAYQEMTYTKDLSMQLRALISELSLHSGGEYTVFLLIEIRHAPKLLTSPTIYKFALHAFVPREFHNITLLWSVPSFTLPWYPGTNQALNQMLHMDQPLQLFAHLHPQFDHFWMMELDVRYTGHWYDLFANADAWARKQARRLLWERNARFYMPHLHRSYKEFGELVANQTVDGGVWGAPASTTSSLDPEGPTPPYPHPDNDTDYEWGVDEDAGFISFAPILPGPKDPTNPDWGIQKGFATPNSNDSAPRTYYLDATPAVRFSREMLGIMHATTRDYGVDILPEIGPATFAYLHGLKAVSFPLPTFYDPVGEGQPRTLEEIERGFNAQGVRNTPWRWGRGDRWNAVFARLTYAWVISRWEQFGTGIYRWWIHGSEVGTLGEKGRKEGRGRLCLPGVLIHPVKEGDVSGV